MNDVVLKVYENPSNKNEIIVTLVAAGCEFNNDVYLGEAPIMFTAPDGTETSEVHAAFGVAKGTLVNTGGRSTTVSTKPIAIITKPEGFDFQTAAFNIVPGGGEDKGKHIGIATSGYPCGIVVPINWAYPSERTCIVNAYEKEGHRFGEWATSADHTKAIDWYNLENATGSVIK
jgi:hypothetical protein